MPNMPRIIHRIWVGPPMPEKLIEIGHQWANILPDWDHILWDEASLEWLINRQLFNQASRLVPADAVGQFKADIARYEILARYGGVYVDCDLEPLRDISSLHIYGAWAGWEFQDKMVGNTILGGQSEDPFWTTATKMIPESVKINTGKRPNWMTGPHFVTRLHERADGLHVYPQSFFYPYGYDQLDRHGEDPKEAYTRHLWWHQRTLQNRLLP